MSFDSLTIPKEKSHKETAKTEEKLLGKYQQLSNLREKYKKATPN
jgi:hypothetical protein